MNEIDEIQEYEVTWGMVYEATDAHDAVRQAIGDLAGVIALPSEGPNIFVARRMPGGITDGSMETVSADEINLDEPLEGI